MPSAVPDYAELARRMLTHESSGARTAAGCAAAVGSVNQRLQHRLEPLIGVAGMRALYARSVKLTCAEFPQLAALRNPGLGDKADIAESLVGLLTALEQSVAWTAATALYANFIDLTTTLIGERLVLLVLQRAFPQIDVSAKQESE